MKINTGLRQANFRGGGFRLPGEDGAGRQIKSG